MKFPILMLLLPTLCFASPIKPGDYFGTGDFSCFFLNSKIIRPLSSHWQIRSLDGTENAFEFIGNYPIVNSQPIYFTAVLNYKNNNEQSFTLYNELQNPKGYLYCKDRTCNLKFKFKSNFAKKIRMNQTIKAQWSWGDSGFKENVKLAFPFLPILATCNAESSFKKTE
jgi:hypothetical protein